jgi:hypothetical protein
MVSTSNARVSGLENYSNYWFAVVAVNISGCYRTNVVSSMEMPEPDLIPPQVISLVPDAPFRVDDRHVEQLFYGFTCTFDEPINTNTLSIADLVVSNTASTIEVRSLEMLSQTNFHVRLAEAYLPGDQFVLIGTNILDLAGNHAEPFSAVVLLSNPALPPGNGDGLLGTYYNGIEFEGSSFPRIDSQIAFDWHENAPMSDIQTDQFSVRWTGRLQPRFDGNYLLALEHDDGVRMWIDGTKIIDNWVSGSHSSSTNLSLSNDRDYEIQIEYFENIADARVHLSWQFETLPAETVPQSQLSSTLSTNEFVAMPAMSPPPGSYVGITQVSLSSATPGADIYYTLGTSDPYTDWTLYTGSPVALDTNQTLRAIAVKSGLNNSGIRVGEYAVDAVSFNLWITARFPGETNLSVIGRSADPDADGIPNIVEYAYCLSPNNPSDSKKIALQLGAPIESWTIAFEIPSNQTAGSFCWSSDLSSWIDVIIEKTNELWVAQSNRCEIITQSLSTNQNTQLQLDTLLSTQSPIFFRFDRATNSIPLAVTNGAAMQVAMEVRKQSWYADLYLRAEDPTIHPFLEIRTNLMTGTWFPPAEFTFTNQYWLIDNPDWNIQQQTEEEFSEWKLHLKLPNLPINAPVYLRYSVRDDLE